MASMTARINTTTHPPPFSLNEWIEANRARLQPPVNNAMIYGKGAQFKLMMVGGPNIRTDFHINRGEEWFWQIKGDMLLKIVDGGTFKDVIIREGECFLLPGGVPHSPQRFAGTMGIVMERERMNEARDGTTELDGLRWYCRSCYHVAHEDFFVCEDLGSQLKVAIDAYYADEKMRTCPHCGTVDALPSVRRGYTTDPVRLDEILYAPPTAASPSVVDSGIQCRNPGPHIAVAWTTTHPPPFSFRGWIDSNRADLQPPVNNKLMFDPSCEFQVQIIGGPNQRTDYHVEEGEEWFYMVQGDMCLKIVDGGEFRDVHIREGESFLLPANIPHSPQRMPNTIGLVIERRRRPRVRTEADAPAGAATTIHEMDHLRWYCSNCRAIVHEDAFVCQNLGSQLKVAIEAYYADEATRTCAACRTIDQKPALRC